MGLEIINVHNMIQSVNPVMRLMLRHLHAQSITQSSIKSFDHYTLVLAIRRIATNSLLHPVRIYKFIPELAAFIHPNLQWLPPGRRDDVLERFQYGQRFLCVHCSAERIPAPHVNYCEYPSMRSIVSRQFAHINEIATPGVIDMGDHHMPLWEVLSDGFVKLNSQLPQVFFFCNHSLGCLYVGIKKII
jgi:hypothetical protein